MVYRLSTADASVPTRLGQTAWLRSQLPAQAGQCITDQLRIEDGLSLVYTDYLSPHELVQTSALEREGRCLTATIGLAGQSSTTGVDGTRFVFASGHSTLAAFGSVRGERRFPAHQRIQQLRLIAEEPLLQRYGLAGLLSPIPPGQSACALFFGKHSGEVQGLAQSLWHLHDRAGSLLEIQIAALSLLSAHTRPLLAPTPAPAETALSARDQALMLHAKDILSSQYAQPLTVAYLCSAVGTNEFKLKQGFRTLFGSSPHRMLTEIRMAKAWELLESGLRVSAVAEQVGFKHLSSFSAAFERYYGRSPKSVRL